MIAGNAGPVECPLVGTLLAGLAIYTAAVRYAKRAGVINVFTIKPATLSTLLEPVHVTQGAVRTDVVLDVDAHLL